MKATHITDHTFVGPLQKLMGYTEDPAPTCQGCSYKAVRMTAMSEQFDVCTLNPAAHLQVKPSARCNFHHPLTKPVR